MVALGTLVLFAAPAVAVAQAPRWQDTLPPRAYVRLAMRARAQDSVAAKAAEWTQWANETPLAVAPRFALSLLARYDVRYGDAIAWLDSASRLAASPVWTNAIARERVTTMIIQGEYTQIPALLQVVLSDSASLPPAEWAESKYVAVAYRRRQFMPITLAALDSVEAISTPADSLLRARLDCMRASAEPARLLEFATAGIAMAEAVGAPFVKGSCQLVVGYAYSSAGQIGSALEWFVRAETTALAAHDEPTLAAAYQLHGYALTTLGYVRSARARLTQAIRIAQRIDDRNVEAWALLSVGHMAQQIGDAVTASTALRRAQSLFRTTGDAIGLQNVRMEQSQGMMALGDLAGAERLATEGRALGDSLNQRFMVVRALYTLSDVATRTNRFAEAAALLDTAEPKVRKLGAAWLTQLREYRGLLSLRRGDAREAIRTLTDVRTEYVARQDLFRYHIDGALSLAYLLAADSVNAERTLIEANRELDAVRDTMAEGGLRKVVLPPNGWGGSSGNLDQVLAAFVQSPRWLPTVFAVTERARSRALLNGTLGSETTTDSATMNAARRRVRASASVLSEVQRALKPSTALLVYAGGASTARTSLMVITKTSARGITLAPLDSLDRDIVRWLTLLESGESGAGAGRRVAAAVLSSALRGLPASVKRLVIVPQGPLYRVPFQALPVGSGVLGDRAVVTISPSVSLALAYAAEPRSVPARVLALGAGDTEVSGFTPQSLDLNIERSERGNPLAPLRAAADEARAAASWGRGSIALTGTDASESALKREARVPYTVLHAAAHALTSDQALGANWLILRADSTDDGYVSGGELAELSAGRAMVVLSGCRTTGDFGSRGDAIDGLVAPLLARGVRTVVASHWAVSDRWTKVLMERFYQNLARGVTTAEAMNYAQTSLRREGVPARFWAAFSVIGDGALTFDPTPAPVGRH